MDRIGCFFGFIFAFALCLVYSLGLSSGRANSYNDSAAVIKEVHISKNERGKYKYITTEFDFVSDSVYQVGDTIKITRY